MEFAKGREPTAIVIDDDKPTTLFLKRLLRMMEVDVLAIGSDGKDAVRLYEKYKPDIVFTDILMPENDGFYAIEEIRKFDPYAKIIAITGDSANETATRLKELNVSAVVYKPFEIEDVKKVLFKEFRIEIT